MQDFTDCTMDREEAGRWEIGFIAEIHVLGKWEDHRDEPYVAGDVVDVVKAGDCFKVEPGTAGFNVEQWSERDGI